MNKENSSERDKTHVKLVCNMKDFIQKGKSYGRRKRVKRTKYRRQGN